MYTRENFKNGKALREAFKAGKQILCYQPGPFGPGCADGDHTIEGPHFPEAHKFYVRVTTTNGIIVKVMK